MKKKKVKPSKQLNPAKELNRLKKTLKIDEGANTTNPSAYIKYFKEHRKFPTPLLCTKCKMNEINFRGVTMMHKLAIHRDVETIVAAVECKECIANQRKKNPVEKEMVEKIVKILTAEEAEARREEIRTMIPDMDLTKKREFVPLIESHSLVTELTKGSCLRPDIFLNNSRYCDLCHFNVWCVAPCKRLLKKNQ